MSLFVVYELSFVIVCHCYRDIRTKAKGRRQVDQDHDLAEAEKKKLTKTKGQKQLRPKQQNKPKRLRDEGARDKGDRKKNRKYGRRRGPFFQKSPIVILSKEIIYDWSTEDDIVVDHNISWQKDVHYKL